MVWIPELLRLSSACCPASVRQAAASSAAQLNNDLNRMFPSDFFRWIETRTAGLEERKAQT
jgi:hypothetical protein